MAKLILEMQTSLDGFMAGPAGQTDWMVWNWGPDWTWGKGLQDFHTALTLSASHIIISRQMAEEGFIAHWQQTAAGKNNQAAFASHISKIPKTVISTTLTKSRPVPGGWDGVELADDMVTAVEKLKRQEGNILVYGGASLVSSMLKHRLVDELFLLVNPVAIGRGLGVFTYLEQPLSLQLRKAESFPCGVTVLHYVL